MLLLLSISAVLASVAILLAAIWLLFLFLSDMGKKAPFPEAIRERQIVRIVLIAVGVFLYSGLAFWLSTGSYFAHYLMIGVLTPPFLCAVSLTIAVRRARLHRDSR